MTTPEQMNSDEKKELAEFERLGDKDAASRKAATRTSADPPPARAANAGANAPSVPPGAEGVQHSKPLPAGTDVSKLPLVDSHEAARALGLPVHAQRSPDQPLGVQSPNQPRVELPAAGEPGGSEHPHDTLQRLRTKLAAYGEECLKAVQPEIEYLMSIADPANDHE